MIKDSKNWCDEQREFYIKCEDLRREFLFNCTESKGNLIIYDEAKISEKLEYEIGFNLMNAKYPLDYSHYDMGFVVDANNKIICVNSSSHVWQLDGDDYQNFCKERFDYCC